MRRRKEGLSLVELMVSLLLGSLLMAALVQLFITNRQVTQQVDASASLIERISFASGFLARHVMEAGMSPLEVASPSPIGTQGSLLSKDGPLSDTLVILSEGGQGCIDETLEDNNGSTEWRRFAINFDNGKNELRCEDSEGGPYPVLDGADAFQVQYGVDANADHSPDYYINASGLQQKDKVVSARIAMLLRGDQSIGMDKNLVVEDWPLLDAVLANGKGKGKINFGDGHLRRMFVTTIALRNTGL